MANKLCTNIGSGGMNAKTSPLIIRDNECELILNYNLDTVGSLTKRDGYITYADQTDASKYVFAPYQYTNSNTPAETTQVCVANNSGDTQAVIYWNNAGTWTASKPTDTVIPGTGGASHTNLLRPRFETFVDYLFRVNGADVMASSKDINGAADGSTWGTTNCKATVVPSFIKVFQDRLYIARGTAAGELSRFWFSGLSDAAESLPAWRANDYVDVNPDDGDEITALENNGNRLLIFKNRSLYRWTYGQVEPDRIFGAGTASQESVKTNFDLGITFFANHRGVFAYMGGRPKLISRKIQPFIDQVSSWGSVCAEVDGDHYYLFVDDVTVDGRTYSNAMFVYTISLDAWAIYTLATPCTSMGRLIATAPVEKIYFGSTDGRTYELNSGTTDNTTAINGEILTKEYLLGLPHQTKLTDVTAFSTERGGVKLRYQLDRSMDWHALNDMTTRFSRFFMRRIGKCNSIRLRLTDHSTTSSKIEGWNFHHTPQPDKYD